MQMERIREKGGKLRNKKVSIKLHNIFGNGNVASWKGYFTKFKDA